MIEPRSKAASLAALGLLAVCWLGCWCVLDGTIGVEQANARRSDQLQRLAARLRGAGSDRVGGCPELDGLFASQIACVETPIGTMLEFTRTPVGGNP